MPDLKNDLMYSPCVFKDYAEYPDSTVALGTGKYLELIGHYNPLTDPQEVKINEEIALKWLRNGAILTNTARDLFSKAGIMKKFHEERQSK